MQDCSIVGCVRPAKYKKTGWCQTHYHRWYRQGDPLKVKHEYDAKGSERYNWSGEYISYRGLHMRLQRHRGKASTHNCERCGASAEHWAYDQSDSNPKWATFGNRTIPYSADISKYVPLCRGCHVRVDRYGYEVK